MGPCNAIDDGGAAVRTWGESHVVTKAEVQPDGRGRAVVAGGAGDKGGRGDVEIGYRDAEGVRLLVRDRLRSSLRAGMLESLSSYGASNDDDDNNDDDDDESDGEEDAGRLGVHVLCLPPAHAHGSSSSSSSSSSLLPIPPSLVSYMRDHMEEMLRHHHRAMHPRKRYRGNDPTSKQGGDPRTNLELRTRRLMGMNVDRVAVGEVGGGGGGGEKCRE